MSTNESGELCLAGVLILHTPSTDHALSDIIAARWRLHGSLAGLLGHHLHTEWSTLIGRELYRTKIFSWCCWRQLSYAIKNQLGTSKAIGGFHGRKGPIIGALMP